jgi:hypothetical protein
MCVRSRSDGYRRYIDVAHQFPHTPEGSPEHQAAREQLATGVAAELGRTYGGVGGDTQAVRSRLRQRAASA